MKHIIFNKIKYLRNFSLFLFVPFFSLSMDPPVEPRDHELSTAKKIDYIIPQKTIKIVDIKRAVANYQPLNEIIPGNMVITPDGNGVIAGHNGHVDWYDIACPFDANKKRIFSHPCVKHSPMIELAQQGKDLLIVSAGNYANREDGNRRESEYIECLFSPKQVVVKNYQVRNLAGPIQSIKLDCNGKLLAIACKDYLNKNQVQICDLKTGEMDNVILRNTLSPEARLVDVAINPAGGFVIAVDNTKSFRLMTLSLINGSPSLSPIQEASSKQDVRRIHCPTHEELLVETLAGEINIINIYELIEPYNEIYNKKRNQTECQGKSLGMPLATISPYDLVAVDPSSQVSIAHWTNKIDGSERKSHSIVKVYRRIKEDKLFMFELFELHVPDLGEKYEYITPLGQINYELGHLLHVAIRGNRIIVLRTDGKMSVYSLEGKEAKRRLLPEELANISSMCYPKSPNYPQRSKKRSSLSKQRVSDESHVTKIQKPKVLPLNLLENPRNDAQTQRRATVGGECPGDLKDASKSIKRFSSPRQKNERLRRRSVDRPSNNSPRNPITPYTTPASSKPSSPNIPKRGGSQLPENNKSDESPRKVADLIVPSDPVVLRTYLEQKHQKGNYLLELEEENGDSSSH